MYKKIYTITGLTKIIEVKDTLNIIASVQIDWSHDIFHGHFPGHPVLPGVIQVQMISEAFSTAVECELVLSEASSIKFINMIVPENCDLLNIEMNSRPSGASKYKVTATLRNDQLTFLKLRGRFSPKELLQYPPKS